ncbi:hypothetical protein DSO57_1015480 [Entomophthora muscae]|uniref:Uncharacterized protein n=1 Tax=Entomophthora muscae TaxID=34485 RepID=A0ACC2TGK6_9FUNG|nr:hypothetical protein DSO57_1015480 [Entomophthora muscae]
MWHQFNSILQPTLTSNPHSTKLDSIPTFDGFTPNSSQANQSNYPRQLSKLGVRRARTSVFGVPVPPPPALEILAVSFSIPIPSRFIRARPLYPAPYFGAGSNPCSPYRFHLLDLI